MHLTEKLVKLLVIDILVNFCKLLGMESDLKFCSDNSIAKQIHDKSSARLLDF